MEKATKRVWKLLQIVLKSRLCVWDAGADGKGRWIFVAVSVDIVDEFFCLMFY